jgi:hypothetical protein
MTAVLAIRSTRIVGGLGGAAVAAVVLGLVLLTVLAPADAMMLWPAALIVLVLAGGAMPGERFIEQLRERRQPRRPRRRHARDVLAPAQPELVAPAGRLCVSALAMRPPPPRRARPQHSLS